MSTAGARMIGRVLSEAGFLCSSDCLAERGGFEPPIQVLARITV
jgi:hypothetical protein